MTRYVSFSGGADSTALAILLHERGEDFKLVFADTGAELPETYYMISKVANVLGRELVVVSNGSFYQHLVNRGYLLPSFRCRWCSETLKRKALAKIFEQGDEVGVGILADEPDRARQGDVYIKTYELLDEGMVKKDVKALCQKYDLLNPIYRWRSRVNCFCCFFQTPTEWLGLCKNHPSLFALAEQWEKLSMQTSQGFTWIQGKRLLDIRIADANQIKLWPEPEGEPCLICTT